MELSVSGTRKPREGWEPWIVVMSLLLVPRSMPMLLCSLILSVMIGDLEWSITIQRQWRVIYSSMWSIQKRSFLNQYQGEDNKNKIISCRTNTRNTTISVMNLRMSKGIKKDQCMFHVKYLLLECVYSNVVNKDTHSNILTLPICFHCFLDSSSHIFLTPYSYDNNNFEILPNS